MVFSTYMNFRLIGVITSELLCYEIAVLEVSNQFRTHILESRVNGFNVAQRNTIKNVNIST